MLGLFKRDKKCDKDKNKDKQVLVSSEIIQNQTTQIMVEQARKTFAKPEYNPQTRKAYYDNGAAHKAAKENALAGGNTIRDPYTKKELVPTIKEAKMKFGDQWQAHLAEADHIDPLNKVAKRAEGNPWVTAEDVKRIGNSQDNFQLISREINQTGGKGGNSQMEWSRNSEKMQEISEMTGESVESLASRISQTGDAAEKRNNVKLARTGVKNATETAHKAGLNGALNSGEIAASISAVYNISSYLKGEKTAKEALIDVGGDTTKAAASGYLNVAVPTVINHTLESSKNKFVAALGEKNVVGKTITVISLTGDTVIKWGNGDITAEECLIELGNTGSNVAGTYCGAMLGKAAFVKLAEGIGNIAIPMPMVGYVLGSMVGGVVSSALYDNMIQYWQAAREEERRRQQEIYEAMMRYYAEQRRRKEVQELIHTNTEAAVNYSVHTIINSGEFQNLAKESAKYFVDYMETEKRIAECVLISLQLKEYRRQMQECIDNYFSEYEYCFASAFQFMDSALQMGDYDGAIIGANQVTRLFGKEPIVENTEDFRKKFFGNSNISF